MDRDYAASVHFDGAGSRFHSDYVLGDPAHRTHAWQPGEIFKQTERVTISPDVPTGRYTAVLGVWSPTDHQGLRLDPWWHPAKARDLFRLDVSTDARTARAPSPP